MGEVTIVAAIAGAMALGVASAAAADAIPPCPVPAGVTAATLDGGAPPALLKALQARFGGMAKPGQPFNATDVVTPGEPGSRFILLWGEGSRWVLAYEQGGIAYNNQLVVFGVAGSSVVTGETRVAEPDTVCAAARALIGK